MTSGSDDCTTVAAEMYAVCAIRYVSRQMVPVATFDSAGSRFRLCGRTSDELSHLSSDSVVTD